MSKILFLQPGYAHYRDDLFSLLSQRHRMHFLFETSRNAYPGKEKPKEIAHTFIDRNFKMKSLGLVYYLFKYNPDIVISSISASFRSMICFCYAAIFRKRFILWILQWRNPMYSKDVKCPFRLIKYWLAKRIIIKSHALVVAGTASHNYALWLGKPDDDIFLAPQCSRDLQNHRKRNHNRKTNKQKYTFLYLSRIISWKGLDRLIRAFHLLTKKRNDVFLLIAGDGPFKTFCQNLSESLKIPGVRFIGSLSPDETKGIFQKADVFVLPSYELDNYYEEWGLVVNEAMSMSLPVIVTTAVGASYDLVIGGYNGLIVQENNIVALYEAMNKILDCDLTQVGTNARRTFEKQNDFAKMADGFTMAIAHTEHQS